MDFLNHPQCTLDYFSETIIMTSLGINSPSYVQEQSGLYSLLAVW